MDFLDELKKAKEVMPNLRYGQIISAALMQANKSYDTFYREDDELAAIINVFILKITKREVQ